MGVAPRPVRVYAFGLELDVPMWTLVAPRLYQGTIPDGPLPVDCILDLYDRHEYDAGKSERFGHHLSDGNKVPPELDTLAEWVYDRWKQGRSIYVHCAAGLNRSGLVVARVLTMMGMSGSEAIQHLRETRSTAVLCNDTFAAHIAAIP